MKRGEKDIFRWGIKEEVVVGYVVVAEHHPVIDGEKICGLECK